MEYSASESILEIRPGAREAVRRAVNLHRPGEIEEAVRILDEWIHQQPHYIYKDLPKPYLESTILVNKGSIEKSKKMIDKLCTLRTLMPDDFKPMDINEVRQTIKGIAHVCFIPKQTEDFYRIIIFRPTVLSKQIFQTYIKACYMLVDYVRLYDYQQGVDVIYDAVDCDLKALASINLMILKDCYDIIHHNYSVRSRRYITITSSKWIEPVVNMVKSFLKKKIGDRIVVLKDYSELHQFYPKEILPKEFGGTERCLDDLQDELLHHLESEKHQSFMGKLFEARTDESKRAPDAFNDLYAGTTGTFRTLTLD